jgi:hypothetical protein
MRSMLRAANAMTAKRVRQTAGKAMEVSGIAATSDRYRRLVNRPKIHAAGRGVRLVGISPVATCRHRVMSSLRASATIMVFRIGPRASAVRAEPIQAAKSSFSGTVYQRASSP